MWIGIGIKFLKDLRLVSSFNKQVVSLGWTSTVEGMKTVGYETGGYESSSATRCAPVLRMYQLEKVG